MLCECGVGGEVGEGDMERVWGKKGKKGGGGGGVVSASMILLARKGYEEVFFVFFCLY